MQFVLDEYKDRLQIYYNEACAATSKTGSKKPALSMDAWCDICKGELRIGSDKKQSAKAKALWKKVKVTYYKGGSEEAKEFALVGDYQVHRESQITGDDRCKEVFKCRLTLLEVKFAFLNSQGMEQMKAGDATDDDAMACLDFEEFLECLCRCGRDKFVECGEFDPLRLPPHAPLFSPPSHRIPSPHRNAAARGDPRLHPQPARAEDGGG